jgi:prepilin-type N-terminal cleavage/methylation domain-containing protein
MFTGPAKETNRRVGESANRGFTLLEIMLAVGILGLMSLAIFRFVQSNMIALRVSSNIAAADAQYDALRDLLTAEWQSLNPQRARLTGEPFKINDRERDVVGWFCSAGPGLLTRYAPGEFKVVLRLQPENEKSDRLDLGLSRKPKDDIGEGHETWVPLIKNVSSLQISYFKPGLTNSWVDRWPGGPLPPLVKITVGRTDTPVPWEAIIPLTRTAFKSP